MDVTALLGNHQPLIGLWPYSLCFTRVRHSSRLACFPPNGLPHGQSPIANYRAARRFTGVLFCPRLMRRECPAPLCSGIEPATTTLVSHSPTYGHGTSVIALGWPLTVRQV